MATTFFIQKSSDGFIFAAEEPEAYEALHGGNLRVRCTLLGTSDGSTYARIKREALSLTADLKAQQAEIERKLDLLDQKADELLVSDDTAENKRLASTLGKKKDKLKDEWKGVQDKLATIESEIEAKAFAAELEEAKKTPRMPQEQRLMDSSGDQNVINKHLGKLLSR
jgi:hypothetical protein